jgi:hypothetical protein
MAPRPPTPAPGGAYPCRPVVTYSDSPGAPPDEASRGVSSSSRPRAGSLMAQCGSPDPGLRDEQHAQLPASRRASTSRTSVLFVQYAGHVPEPSCPPCAPGDLGRRCPELLAVHCMPVATGSWLSSAVTSAWNAAAERQPASVSVTRSARRSPGIGAPVRSAPSFGSG